MISEEVINEIYKNYSRPPKHREDLNLDHYISMLKDIYDLTADDMEIIVGNLDDFSPFKRFLIRALHAVLDLDSVVAFVFESHILFFDKNENQINVNFKPEKKRRGLLGLIFGD